MGEVTQSSLKHISVLQTPEKLEATIALKLKEENSKKSD